MEGTRVLTSDELPQPKPEIRPRGPQGTGRLDSAPLLRQEAHDAIEACFRAYFFGEHWQRNTPFEEQRFLQQDLLAILRDHLRRLGVMAVKGSTIYSVSAGELRPIGLRNDELSMEAMQLAFEKLFREPLPIQERGEGATVAGSFAVSGIEDQDANTDLMKVISKQPRLIMYPIRRLSHILPDLRVRTEQIEAVQAQTAGPRKRTLKMLLVKEVDRNGLAIRVFQFLGERIGLKNDAQRGALAALIAEVCFYLELLSGVKAMTPLVRDFFLEQWRSRELLEQENQQLSFGQQAWHQFRDQQLQLLRNLP